MRKHLLGIALVLAASSASAQTRPSSVAMTCRQAAGLVGARGAVVLGTGGYTYDRFVADQRFCLNTEMTEPAWVPTRDTPQCFVGYRCKERERFWDW